MTSIESNRTLQILRKASGGKYAILAQSCYGLLHTPMSAVERPSDAQGVIVLIRAAESADSPAIAQLFPVTMAQFGLHFVRFVVEACHAVSVPISVYVDHAASDADITRVFDFAQQGAAVDSIMIDCSHHDSDEENIQAAAPYCKQAAELGMAVEVELGRLARGEAGVQTIEEGALTKPEKAQRFMSQLDVHLLAPSIGNIHGTYVNPPDFGLNLLDQLQAAIGPGTECNGLIVLHGTDELPDQLFEDCVQRGCLKVNVNSCARDRQVDYWKGNLGKQGLDDVYDGGMQEFAKSCTRFFDLLGSAGKA